VIGSGLRKIVRRIGRKPEDYGKQSFRKHWQASLELTLAVARAMPAEAYDFKPDTQAMTFAELMVHIAAVNSSGFARVAGTDALSSPVHVDKQVIVQFLEQAFAKCAREYETLTLEQLNRLSGPEGRQATGIERLWAAFTHTAHHRGQAEVYLRMNHISPPEYRF